MEVWADRMFVRLSLNHGTLECHFLTKLLSFQVQEFTCGQNLRKVFLCKKTL